MNSRKLFFLSIGSLIIFFSFYFWFHRQTYLQTSNPQKIEDRYFNSSYGKIRAQYILSDEELYVAEGHFLVDKKIDLNNLNAGHPPFGKYLIGISTALFNNPYIFAAVFGIAFAYVFFVTARTLSISPVLAVFTTLAFMFEKLFNEQLSTSLLDIYLLVLSFLSLLLYLKFLKTRKYSFIFLSQFFLGLSMATKFFPTSAPLAVALVLTTVLSGDFKLFKRHMISLLFVAIGFALGHITYFFYHPSIIEFIKYNRYVNSWWAGSPQVPPFQALDLIYFNNWHTWWDKKEIISTPYWWIGWPIIISLALIAPIPQLLRRKLTLPFAATYLWLILLILLFCFEAIYPRHLLLALPVAYLVVTQMLASR